jgi:hypothetical protein
MRRNMDLIREILLAREADRQINTRGISQAQLAEHVRMLQEAGFIEALIGGARKASRNARQYPVEARQGEFYQAWRELHCQADFRLVEGRG